MTKEEASVVRAAMRWFYIYARVDSESLHGTLRRELVGVHRACARLASAKTKGKK